MEASKGLSSALAKTCMISSSTSVALLLFELKLSLELSSSMLALVMFGRKCKIVLFYHSGLIAALQLLVSCWNLDTVGWSLKTHKDWRFWGLFPLRGLPSGLSRLPLTKRESWVSKLSCLPTVDR